ncbi:MAG: hypothetical protein FWB95_09190 [Treponema sp.]|nr:hypothetical protein [Treponema sp.]
MEKIIQFIDDWFHNLNAGQKRRLAIVSTVVFTGILTLSVLLSLSKAGKGDARNDSERLTVFAPIPAEELFLPDEPDYIPKVILEREQRSFWTEEDAAEYWQDPLRGGEEKWRQKIEEAADELLENVP